MEFTKSAFLLCVLFWISSYSFGQSKHEFGLKGGLNVSTLGKEGSGYSPKLGYHAGLFYTWRMYQEFGLEAEFLLSQHGARNEFVSQIRLNYTYLAVPVFVNIYFLESAAIETGLQAGYLLNATQVDSGEKFDIRDEVIKFDFSGILGINYSKPYGTIGIRYVLGINNTNNASRSAEITFKNKTIQLYISKNLLSPK